MQFSELKNDFTQPLQIKGFKKIMHFKNLNLIIPIVRAVTESGYSKPTEIQIKAIPHILEGRDVIGCAQTGPGKTAAFAMSILQLMKKKSQEHKDIRTLIITPTRELAIQIEENLKLYSKYLPLSQLSIFEGVSQGSQISALRKRVDILIATPARLLDLCNQGHINLSKIEILVLDEADIMLDMGFVNEVKKILKLIPQKRQTLFFSATMSDSTRKLAEIMLNNPVEITVNPVSSTAETLEQSVYFIEKNQKTGLDMEGKAASFCDEEERSDLESIQELIGFTMPVAKKNTYFNNVLIKIK